MFTLGPLELLVLALLALAVFAPERLPQLGWMLGRAVAQVRRALRQGAPAPSPRASLSTSRTAPVARATPDASRDWRATFDVVDATVIAIGLSCVLIAAWAIATR
ncbi:MAG: twin-arginine translocase TatA/TatE family subunit [Alphaproteobacteria bacterium]|nr:twin-arginine translocase TatA/TatE family subunit [Alphaproteobacteria bacterium]